jgi:hypothetical protein
MPRLAYTLVTASFALCAGYSAAQQPNLAQPPEPATSAQAQAKARVDAPAASAEVRQRGNAAVQAPAPPNEVQNDNIDRSVGAQVNNEIQAEANPNAGRAALGVTFSNGMTVGRISPNSPAAMLGLQPGDQIIRLNGEDFSDANLFVNAISQSPLDQDAEIIFLRNGQEHTVNGRLAPWESVFAGTGYAQPHTTMRYADPGVVQGGYVDGSTAVCCDPCAGDSGSYGGYGGWQDDDYRYSRRAYRRAWGWGWGWGW